MVFYYCHVNEESEFGYATYGEWTFGKFVDFRIFFGYHISGIFWSLGTHLYKGRRKHRRAVVAVAVAVAVLVVAVVAVVAVVTAAAQGREVMGAASVFRFACQG